MSLDTSAALEAGIAALIARGGPRAELAAVPALRHFLSSDTLPLPELLHRLGEPLDEPTLRRRAADPSEPPRALTLLAGLFPAEFCANPVVPLLLLEDPGLPNAFPPDALGRLLSYAGVPGELLAAVAQLGPPEGALAARLHVGMGGEAGAGWRAELAKTVAQLPVFPDDDLMAVLLALGAVPAWLQPRLERVESPRLAAAAAATSGNMAALIALARPATARPRPATPTRELPRLLESEAPAERARAAADPRVPPALLLAAKAREDVTDVEYDVYEALAANPAAPPELLVALARDMSALNTRTRRLVALHAAAPPAALTLLADEPYAADIRLTLAAHPNLSPELRARLLAHSLAQAIATPDPCYRAVALAHPDTSPELLAAHADSPHWIERVAVALNPGTPPDARRLLAEDGNRLVRAAARSAAS